MSKDKTVNFVHFQSIDSTNSWAKSHAHLLDPQKITCITAHEQFAGRGRFKNQWFSPPGKNIYTTFYFCTPKDAAYIQNLGQILSLSCCKSLQHFGFDPQIKWPNDILLEGKKIAGILCEVVPLEELSGIALGIGINVNMDQKIVQQIDQPATSLLIVSGKAWNLDLLLQHLLSSFLEDLRCLELQGFESFTPLYQELLAYKGTLITVKNGEKQVSGVCHSVSAKGSLILKADAGEIEVVAGVILQS